VGKAFAVAGAIVIVLGGAAIGYAVTRHETGGMSETQSAAMASAVARLDGDLKALGDVVHARAASLSAPAAIRSAIGTDAATVGDLIARGDFVPEKDESLELGQVEKATSRIEVLLPRGAVRASHDGAIGRYVELAGDQLLITEVIQVVPAYNPDKYAGFHSANQRSRSIRRSGIRT
jgi:hypothetical protein